MSSSKKLKRKKVQEEDHDLPKPDKRDYAIAKYLYQHVPMRIGDLHGMEVQCFYAEDAINTLLDSPWATGSDHLFTDRESCIDYGSDLLCKEFFHRARLAKRKPKPVKSTGSDGNETPAEEAKRAKKEKKNKEGDEKSVEEKDKKKKLKKLKLEMGENQFFDDGKEIYVWIYEPVSWRNFIIGSLILVGLIAVCCYPLWPPIIRTGVYYLSLGGAGFLGVILFLAVFRYVVYGLVLALSFGKHKFFLFPNLTEDCGFFESFVPVYEYSQAGDEENKKLKGSKKSEPADSKDIKSVDEPEALPVDDGNSEDSNEFEVIKNDDATN